MLKLTIKRYIYYWLYVLIGLGIPIAVINQTYGLLEQTTTEAGEFTKLRATSFVVIFIVLFFGMKMIIGWYKNLPDTSLMKSIGEKLMLPVGLGVLWLILNFSDRYIENLTYVIYWSFISNVIAFLIALLHQKVLNQIVVEQTLQGQRR
jgi:uncharacterized protein YacL